MKNWLFKDTGSGQTVMYDEKTGKSIAVFYDPKEAERLRDYLEASLNHISDSDIQDAITESMAYNCIVHLPWSQKAEDELTTQCVECVPECGEFWGEDWRVHLDREEVDA